MESLFEFLISNPDKAIRAGNCDRVCHCTGLLNDFNIPVTFENLFTLHQLIVRNGWYNGWTPQNQDGRLRGGPRPFAETWWQYSDDGTEFLYETTEDALRAVDRSNTPL